MQRRTITAVFNSAAEAERAADALATRVGGVRAAICAAERDRSMLDDLRLGPDDQAGFEEAMRRGHAVVVARVPEGHFDTIAEVLESAGALDMDEQEDDWRKEGWMGGAPDGAGDNPPGTMASRGLDKLAGTNVSGAHSENDRRRGMTDAAERGDDPPGTMLSRGVDKVAGTSISGAHPENQGGTGTSDVAPADNEAIPVVEERLRIGKREVEHGRVRIRSYVVETPVEEQVTLRREHVDIERHSVDRPVEDADRLFQDRIIEARESAEEAVVSKEARVKEEVRLRKQSEDNTETVRDSVRRTEVEVQDDRGTNAAGKSGTASGGIATPGSSKPTGNASTRSGSGSS